MRVTLDDAAYPGLKKFKVTGKELQSLPSSLFHLSDLEILDLSPTRETCLTFHLLNVPKEIGLLTHLKVSGIIVESYNGLITSLSNAQKYYKKSTTRIRFQLRSSVLRQSLMLYLF